MPSISSVKGVSARHILPKLSGELEEDDGENVNAEHLAEYLIKLIEFSPQVCKSFYLRWWLLQPVSDDVKDKNSGNAVFNTVPIIADDDFFNLGGTAPVVPADEDIFNLGVQPEEPD